MIRLGLLSLVPLAPALHTAFGLPPLWAFLAGILRLGTLTDWIRAATQQPARHSGPGGTPARAVGETQPDSSI